MRKSPSTDSFALKSEKVALPRRFRNPLGMKNPTSIRDPVEAVELADATLARDGGERATVQPGG